MNTPMRISFVLCKNKSFFTDSPLEIVHAAMSLFIVQFPLWRTHSQEQSHFQSIKMVHLKVKRNDQEQNQFYQQQQKEFTSIQSQLGIHNTNFPLRRSRQSRNIFFHSTSFHFLYLYLQCTIAQLENENSILEQHYDNLYQHYSSLEQSYQELSKYSQIASIPPILERSRRQKHYTAR